MSHETWSSGTAYDRYIGRWSRPVAVEFVDWLGPRSGGDWVDVGSGSGALTGTIVERAAPAHVVGVDPSDDFVSHARTRVTDPRVEFVVGDGAAIPVPDRSADYVVSGLVLNFIPDVSAALSDMIRVARPGATVAAYVWDYAEGMQMLREFWDAAIALDPDQAHLDEAVRFPLCHPDELERVFDAAGLVDVAGRGIVVDTPFADFDDFWTPFLGGQGPAPGYCATLSDDRLSLLRERLRDRLAPDGSMVALSARAWAITATRDA